MYRDPAELAWERAQQMAQENQADTASAGTTEANEANGSAQVQQPKVPKRGRGRPKKSVKDPSTRAGRDVDLRVSDVRGDLNPDSTQLSTVREPRADQGREAPAERRNLKPNGHAESSWIAAQRTQAQAGFQAFERFAQEAPLKDAFDLYNEFVRRITDAGNRIESRRQQDKATENTCSFCEHVFTYRGTDSYYARRAFDLPDGRVQVVMSCRKSRCIDEFDRYVNDMAMRSRATLHE